MLPGRDGIEILKELRRDGNKPAVLLLTARDAEEDRVLGLDSGADDYLVKPFAFAELLARLRVLLRRSGPEEAVRRQVAALRLRRSRPRSEAPTLNTPRERAETRMAQVACQVAAATAVFDPS